MSADAILAELLSDTARADPYPHYRALRELGPIAPLAQGLAGATPFTAVATGYDLIDQVLRDVSFYKKSLPGWQQHTLLTTFETSMMFSNPPDHTRMRALFSKTFTPRRLAAIDPIIESVVLGLLDRMEERGAGGASVDFVENFAAPLPALVMAAFVGIPAEDLDWYQARVRPIDAFLDLDGKTPDALEHADHAAQELRDFYADLIDRLRKEPQEDLLSALIQSIDAGEHQLSDAELISNMIVLFNASFLTTIYLLGSGLPLLLSRPDVTAALPGDDELALDCVHEILRCESPVQFLTRAAPEEVELAGVPVPKDGVVLLLVGAANRDPDRFTDPDTFEPGRPKLISLGFGAGPHYCVGAAVSRAEGRVALPMLFQRFPDLALAGEPVGTGSLFLRGMKSVPVTLS
ncbi:MAG TPA: cytochrome P450 [Jatrophihabitans sp.]|nr:cytochrome P450 [Jatrophihabitans sp.]